MSNEFEIEKDIPMPSRRIVCRTPRYPYADMEIGDSFFVPLTDDEDRAKLLRRIRQSTMWAKRRYTPHKFSMRAMEDGVRVWRVA